VHQKHGAFHYVYKGKWTRLATNIADAFLALSKVIAAQGGQREGPMSMPQLLAHALPVITAGKSKGTEIQYAWAIKTLTASFEKFTVEQVEPKHIYAMRRQLRGQPAKFNLYLSVIRLALELAVEDGVIKSSPALEVSPLQTVRRDRYITHEEYATIYRQASPLLQIVMELAYRTGQRIQDVLRIELAQLVDQGIWFLPQKTRRMGKKIIVAWTPELREAVQRARDLSGKVQPITRYLLPMRKGQAMRYDMLRTEWAQTVAASGVPKANLNDLRAKAASDLETEAGLLPGQGLANAQALLAHSASSTTKIYTRNRQATLVHGPRGKAG
jgi:integrase